MRAKNLSIFIAACMLSHPILSQEASSTLPTDESNIPEYRVVLEPYYRTTFTPEILQPVEIINFRMGDHFKKGDTLIKLEATVLEANARKAEAALDMSKAEYTAKQELFKDGIASLFEVKEATAAVAAAEADLAIAQKNLKASMILAPYNGKVVELGIEKHEVPIQGKPLIQILDDRILRARLLLPASLFSQIRVGERITIYVAEIGRAFSANVTRIGAALDPSSSTFKIEAEIDNSKGELSAGMVGISKLGKAVYDATDTK